jgi:hypothetical protein
MPRWPKKVETVLTAETEIKADLIGEVKEEVKEIRTTCDDAYHISKGEAIGGGLFTCDICKNKFTYSNGFSKKYV